MKKKSGKWYGRLPGSTKPVPLCTNKVAAGQLLAEKVKKAELRRAGLIDPYEDQRTQPLTDHLADYRRELEARDNDPRYVALVHARLIALCEGCGFRTLQNLSASRVMDRRCEQRRTDRVAELPADVDPFPRAAAAAARDMTVTAFRDAVKRLGLPVIGNGPARRYPRATVEAVRDRQGRGSSVQTTNYYLSHLKSFCRWLVKDRRLPESPVVHLKANNAGVDRRHGRRELAAEELRRLLAAARASARTLRGLAGADRFMLYATACGTGFRAGALASLTPAHFDLAGPTPTVALAARANKSRKSQVQPLPADLADLLRGYVAGRPAHLPLWPGEWPRKGDGAELLRADLADAGIPYFVDGPDGPLYADFHSLRHSYLTLGGRAGIDLRTLQELAGHSTPALTARYMHVRLHDMAASVDRLPDFLPTGERPRAEPDVLPATGTGAAGLSPVCTGFVQTADLGCAPVRPSETRPPSGRENPSPDGASALSPLRLIERG